jgi:hypothetical protein
VSRRHPRAPLRDVLKPCKEEVASHTPSGGQALWRAPSAKDQ